MNDQFILDYPKFISIELCNQDGNFFPLRYLKSIDLDRILGISFTSIARLKHINFKILLQHLSKYHLILSIDIVPITTNFNALDKVIDYLSQIRIPLYSANSHKHDEIIGEKDSFKHTLSRIIQNEKYQKKSIVLLMPITEKNFGNTEIITLYEFAKKNNVFFSPYIQAKFDPNYSLPQFEYKRILITLANLYAKDKGKTLFLDEPLIFNYLKESNRCPAGTLLIHINSHGEIYPCVHSSKKIGSIATSNIRVSIRNFRKIQRHSECSSCKFITVCGGGCVATKTNNIYNNDPYCFICTKDH